MFSAVILVDAVFGSSGFVKMLQTDGWCTLNLVSMEWPVLITLAGYAVHRRSLETIHPSEAESNRKSP